MTVISGPRGRSGLLVGVFALITAALLLVSGCATRDSEAAAPEPERVDLADLSDLVLKVGDQKGGTEAILTAAGLVGGCTVIGLALVPDAPGKLPKTLRRSADVVGSADREPSVIALRAGALPVAAPTGLGPATVRCSSMARSGTLRSSAFASCSSMRCTPNESGASACGLSNFSTRSMRSEATELT